MHDTRSHFTPSSPALPQLWTTDEVAEYLRVDRRTLYRWIKEADFPVLCCGGLLRFDAEAVNSWLKERR